MAHRNEPAPASGLSFREKIAAGMAAGVAVAGVVVGAVVLARKKAPTLADQAAAARAALAAAGFPVPAPGTGQAGPKGPDQTTADVAKVVDTGTKVVDTGVKVAGTISDLAAAAG